MVSAFEQESKINALFSDCSHVIDSNVIDSVMFTFAENGITRYNLVNSAIVELLTFISKKVSPPDHDLIRILGVL